MLITSLFNMANFYDCRAEGNGLGGFVTMNPNSNFTNCEAVNNIGPGFLELDPKSDHALNAWLAISRVGHVVNADANFEGKEEIQKELLQVRTELEALKPKGSVIKTGLERILALAKLAGAAKSAVVLLNDIPAIHDFIVTHAPNFPS